MCYFACLAQVQALLLLAAPCPAMEIHVSGYQHPRQWSDQHSRQWSDQHPRQWSGQHPRQWSDQHPRQWSVISVAAHACAALQLVAYYV